MGRPRRRVFDLLLAIAASLALAYLLLSALLYYFGPYREEYPKPVAWWRQLLH